MSWEIDIDSNNRIWIIDTNYNFGEHEWLVACVGTMENAKIIIDCVNKCI